MKTLPFLVLLAAAGSTSAFFSGAAAVACAFVGFGIACLAAAEYVGERKPLAIRGNL